MFLCCFLDIQGLDILLIEALYFLFSAHGHMLLFVYVELNSIFSCICCFFNPGVVFFSDFTWVVNAFFFSNPRGTSSVISLNNLRWLRC